MADKTWTATDIEQGSLTITPKGGGILHIHRRYSFLDEEEQAILQIRPGKLVADVTFSELPESMRNALTTIDAWTKNQALEQEGMSE